MIVHVYSVMRNEEKLLPYFLSHYEQFADKIYIFNDRSTDHTVDIASTHPKVVLENFPYPTAANEDDFNRCLEAAYKQSRGVADYVMVVDGDELLYCPDMIKQLECAKKDDIKVIRTIGYAMIGDRDPETEGQLYDEYKDGIRERGFDKPVVFDPNLDVKFAHGRHDIYTSVPPIKCNILLLHFRYISKQFYLKRSEENYTQIGMSPKEKSYRLRRGLEHFDLPEKFTIERVV
jgi:hypothetical protein